MKSTAACAADGLRRTFLLPRLVQRRNRGHRPTPVAHAQPRD
jgi:hypothetical protein